jgi:hypothetical protein
MSLREMEWDGMDWIRLVRDRDKWRALVNTLMNLRVSIRRWRILEQLKDWWLLKKGSAAWN